MRAGECTELAATITGDSDTAGSSAEDVSIVIASQRRPGWRREFRMLTWHFVQPTPLLLQGTGLVSLAIENKFLTGLLESAVSFPALREFRINLRASGQYATMIWPVAWGISLDEDHDGAPCTGYSVPCPSLETMTIAAAVGAPMQVKLSEVAQLAEALGQLGREDGKRARLVLRGVSLQVPALDQLFSSVQEVAPQTA